MSLLPAGKAVKTGKAAHYIDCARAIQVFVFAAAAAPLQSRKF
jgi:hypothetical protein